MLSLDFIRNNQAVVEAGAKNKGVTINLQRILDLDEQRKGLISQEQALREKRNALSKISLTDEVKQEGRKIKDELKELEAKRNVVDKELTDLLMLIPNLPAEDVKVGKNESENEIVKMQEEPKKFAFKVRDHLQLGELLDIIDVKRASKISGARFGYLKNEGALLELALQRLAFDRLVQEGFIPIIPPTLIKRDTMKALGYMEHGGEEDMFGLARDDLFLVGTAEQSIVPMHKDEVFNPQDLPRRYVGFSTSYRREAGSYGKDTRGIFRVHQFDKVEMVSFVSPEKGDDEHEYLLRLEEELFQLLEIPYQVVKMCTGDLGFPAARKYDIEAWFPSQERFREVTSTSTTTEFQARRLNTRYRKGAEKGYVHILNGTAFSMNRPILAILENHQQPDGSVLIPKALRAYTGFDTISPPQSTKSS